MRNLSVSADFVSPGGCIKAAIGLYDPLTTFDGKKYGGTCVNIFEILMDKLGFCFEYIPSPNGLWGIEFPNGSWDGLMGLLQRQEVDIIACPIAPTYRRHKIVEFAKNVLPTFYFIIYPRPQVKPNFAGFMMPFTYEAWVVIFGVLLVLSLASFLLNKFLNKTVKDERNSNVTYLPTNAYFTSLISQPMELWPEYDSCRVFLTAWLFAAFIINNLYKSNLTALLTVPRIVVPFDTLHELVNQNEYKWSFLADSIIPQYFKPAYEEDPNSVMGKGWNLRGELYTNADQILSFVVERKMACISLSCKVIPLFAEDFSKTGKCRIAAARQKLLTLELTFALKKKSKLTPMIDTLIMNMNEFGILSKIFNEGSENSTYCMVPPGKEGSIQLRPLTVIDFMGTFMILGGGLILAIIVFVVEVLMSCLRVERR